jgi:hypothetical protein
MEFSDQQLNLTSTNGLSLTIPSQYSYQTCTLKVSVRLGTATNFRVVISGSSVLAQQTFTALNTSTFADISLSFTPTSSNIIIYVGGVATGTAAAQTSGTVNTYAWSIFAGNSISTELLGNLLIPHGTIQALDLLYGPSLSSLAPTLSNYALTSSCSSYAMISSLSSYATTASLESYALTSALSAYA